MRAKHDKLEAKPEDWERAVRRERVLRRLVENDRNTPVEIGVACRELGVRRSRLYQLLKRYRAEPLASALLMRPSGMVPGARRLGLDLEAVIGEAITTVYATRQRASVHAVHREVQRLCRLKALKPPSYHSVSARIASWDAEDLSRAREGGQEKGPARRNFDFVQRRASTRRTMPIRSSRLIIPLSM